MAWSQLEGDTMVLSLCPSGKEYIFELKAVNRIGAEFKKVERKTIDINWIAEWHSDSVLYAVTGWSDAPPASSRFSLAWSHG